MNTAGAADPDQPQPQRRDASRGAVKLRHALERFHLDVRGLQCVDFGASKGGFTDCLLQAGAASVVAIDTAYGEFDYRLRIDDRVTLLERTNALRAAPPARADLRDLAVIDLGWTPQRLAVPAALRWLGDTGAERLITLIKPHYEVSRMEGVRPQLEKGVLDADTAQRVMQQVLDDAPQWGARAMDVTQSPIRGGARGKGRAKGNLEWLALLERARP